MLVSLHVIDERLVLTVETHGEFSEFINLRRYIFFAA